jgi:hypothetical protein
MTQLQDWPELGSNLGTRRHIAFGLRAVAPLPAIRTLRVRSYFKTHFINYHFFDLVTRIVI